VKYFDFVMLMVAASFGLGVWLAPLVRNDYAEFKAFVVGKLKAAEQAAKDAAQGAVNKL
jgi:hypothetical protein